MKSPIKKNPPKGFDQWDIAGDKNLSVAHVAALYGNLPIGFDRWEIADTYDISVRDIYNGYV